MKRAAVLGLSLCLIVALFSFPVHAENMGADTWKTGSNLINNVSVVADVIEARATQVGGSGSSIVWQKDFLVTVQIQNLVDSPVLINGLKFSLSFSSGSNVQLISYDSYSSDAWISNDGNYFFTIVPSNDFSYANGIVVPPSESIWVVGTITAQRTSDSNSNFNLSAVTVPTFTTARSDNYPYGATVNWAPLISAIDQYFNTQHVDNNNILTVLGSIKVDSAAAVSSLSDIVDLLTYTGSVPSYSPSNRSSTNFQLSSVSTLPAGFSMSFNISRLSSFIIDQDFEALYPDISFTSGSYANVFELRMLVSNSLDTAVSGPSFISISDILPRSNVTYLLLSHSSDIFSDPFFADVVSGDWVTLQYRPLVTKGSLAYYPTGTHVSVAYVLAITSTPLVVSNNTAASFSSGTYTRTNLYIPSSELFGIADLYNGLVNPSSSVTNDPGDLNDNSGTVEGQVETIHNQEMQYFQQNQQAIEDVGLSNFRFNQNYVNAFSMITTQFSSLWNALSDYSLIYIFTLLLSLATYIIRHEPTTKVKQYRSSVAAERAERISYYGSMNAARRAGSKTSPEMRAAVRRLNRK